MRFKKLLILSIVTIFAANAIHAQEIKTKTVQKQKIKTVEIQKQEVVKHEKKAENDFERKVQQQIAYHNQKQIEKKQALTEKKEAENKKTKSNNKVKKSSSNNSNVSKKIEKTVKIRPNKKKEKIKYSSSSTSSKIINDSNTSVNKISSASRKKSKVKSPAFDSKTQYVEQKEIINPNHELAQKPRVEKKKIHQGNGYHQPHVVVESQHITYISPKHYHYYVPARYIYRGVWIRYYIDLPDGYVFYNGYPYFVYNNFLHRYSVEDKGYYDLVDSWNDETYATFYGDTLKESYDRCADLRDRLNAEYEEERYFVAERFDYDPDYKYGWDPDDYPDWYWY